MNHRRPRPADLEPSYAQLGEPRIAEYIRPTRRVSSRFSNFAGSTQLLEPIRAGIVTMVKAALGPRV